MGGKSQDILKLSTGVELEMLRPSPLLVNNAMKEMPGEPKPPQVFIEAKGREEENPNDPDYLDARRAWLADAGLRSLRALIPTGSKFHSKPDDIVGPEDDDYVDLLESMGVQPAMGVHSRYVQWVMLVAAGPQDLEALGIQLMRRAGVREEDVREAQDLFPGHQERGPNNGAAAERGGEHGNPVRARRGRAGARN